VRNWIRLVRFACPTCGQQLAVERGQIDRNEVVTCQDCNARLRLVRRGAALEGGSHPAPDAALSLLVEL
jgi:DNA-directed RNA polymerase subunit RPC12/RpoP